jgi:hypothetical protein
MSVGTSGVGAPEAMFPARRRPRTRRRRYKASHLAFFFLSAFALLALTVWGVIFLPKWF